MNKPNFYFQTIFCNFLSSLTKGSFSDLRILRMMSAIDVIVAFIERMIEFCLKVVSLVHSPNELSNVQNPGFVLVISVIYFPCSAFSDDAMPLLVFLSLFAEQNGTPRWRCLLAIQWLLP